MTRKEFLRTLGQYYDNGNNERDIIAFFVGGEKGKNMDLHLLGNDLELIAALCAAAETNERVLVLLLKLFSVMASGKPQWRAAMRKLVDNATKILN